LYYTEARVIDVIDQERPTQTATTAPSGGAVIDVEARAAITDIITKLQAANIYS